MSLTNVEAVFFLPVVLAVHWALPRRAAWQNAWLLAASYVFYFAWNPRLIGVLLVATAIDYFAALWIAGHRPAPGEEGTPEGIAKRRRMRAALIASLTYNVAQLAFFKYEGFFAESLNQLLTAAGLPGSLRVLQVALPIGLSFYTLQKIAYVVDVYNGQLEPCRSRLTFATFVAFFPQIVAGPIPRGHELLPQLARPRALSADQLRSGAATFLLGFVKKAFAADILAQAVVNPVFGSAGQYTSSAHWAALLAYAAQIYFDFSGYTDLAIGCGRLLGIELPENFRQPFVSLSLREVWQRWHITLNRWLFDYIYGPLVTSGGFWRGRLDLGLLAVFLISGLWHGAQWTFVLWGALHGLGLVVHRRWDEYYRGLCRRDRNWVARRRLPAYAAAAWFLTQGWFVLSLVPFRATSLDQAGAFFAALLGGGGSRALTISMTEAVCLPVIVALFLLDQLQARPLVQRARDLFVGLPAPVRGIAYGLLLVFLLLFTPLSGGTFIYAQF